MLYKRIKGRLIMENYNGFYKVAENNGGVCVGTFFNPDTMEHFSKKTWDIDDDRLLWDEEIQILRFLPINEDVRRIWMHHNGEILIGDTVEVFKGRKIPIGYIGVVENIKPFYDRYGRWQANYIYFADGKRTNYNNCKLIKEA
jgi:hypothetical protein